MSTPTTSAAPAASPAVSTQVPVTPETAAPLATGAPAPQPTAAQVARMLKFKEDGKDVELPESEVIQLAQKGRTADRRFQEAATTRKQAEEIIKFAQDNPEEFFNKTGKNARQWAEDYLMKVLEHENRNPEQKKAYENEQRLKKYEADEKAQEQQKADAKRQALEQDLMKTWDEKFTAALGATDLPKTPYTVMRMATLTKIANKNGLPITPEQIATLVKEDYERDDRARISGMDGNALLNWLRNMSPDAIKKLSKAQLAEYKTSKSSGAKKQQGTPSKRDEPVNPIDAWKEMKKKNRSFY